MTRFDVAALGLVVLGFAPSCGRGESTRPPAEAAAGPFDARLLEAAREYGRWSRVSSSLGWALADCVTPATPADQPLHASASEDAATHGQKLYYLFARDRAAYVQRPRDPAPSGQVIVKESWTPSVVPPDESPVTGDTAVRSGQRYRAGTRAGLFMMMKLDPGAAGTDQGWVYGVVSGDGGQVMAAGRLDKCVDCHVRAPGDRLFGPPL